MSFFLQYKIIKKRRMSLLQDAPPPLFEAEVDGAASLPLTRISIHSRLNGTTCIGPSSP